MKPAQTALNQLHAFGGGTIHLSDQWQTRGVVRKPEFTFANSGYIYINLVTFENNILITKRSPSSPFNLKKFLVHTENHLTEHA